MLTDDRNTEVGEDDIFLMLSGSPTGTGCSGNEKRKKGSYKFNRNLAKVVTFKIFNIIYLDRMNKFLGSQSN